MFGTPRRRRARPLRHRLRRLPRHRRASRRWPRSSCVSAQLLDVDPQLGRRDATPRLVRTFVTSTLSPDDLAGAGRRPSVSASARRRLAYARRSRRDRAHRDPPARRPGRRRRASRGPRGHGPASAGLRHGPDRPTRDRRRSSTSAASEAVGPALATSRSLREYFPLVTDGQVRAVVGVWRDAVPILRQLDDLRRSIVLVTLSAALVAAVALLLRLPLGAGADQPPGPGPRRGEPARHADRLRSTTARWSTRSPSASTRSRADGPAVRRSPCSTSTTSGCSTRRTATPPATTRC